MNQLPIDKNKIESTIICERSPFCFHLHRRAEFDNDFDYIYTYGLIYLDSVFGKFLFSSQLCYYLVFMFKCSTEPR